MIVAVMTPREVWTDERLDDLNQKVDRGFARVDADIRDLRRDMNHQVGSLRSEMNARFESVEARFESVDARFDAMSKSVNERFDALNRNLLAGLVAIVAAVIGSNLI
jgi:ribosome recycling factor